MNPALLHQVLAELGDAGRTGALYVDGRPGGVLYLVAGHLTYAESPACPGVGERLVACGRLSAATWQAAYDRGRGAHRVGRVLVAEGHLGRHELACRVVAAISDATHALLQQSGDAAVRFVPGERHWLGVITQVDLGVLIREAAQRLRRVPVPRGHHDPGRAGRSRPGPMRGSSRRAEYAGAGRVRQAARRTI